MSAFVLEDGVVYHTYSTYARGLDGLWGMYQWLDRAPQGTQRDGRLVAPPRRVRDGRSEAMREMPMPGGWTMSMTWMRVPGQTWAGAASFLAMWIAMMVAMMLPCSFRRSRATGTPWRRRIGSVSAG